MAVDDAGRGRVQAGDAGELGLQRQDLGLRHPNHVGHAVGVRLLLYLFKFSDLGLVRSHDQFAAAPMRHPMRHAVFVQQLLAGDAAARLQRSFRVIDAGVDDLRIARAGMGADRVLGLEDHHLASGHGEATRDGEADHARADDDRVKFFHAAAASRK
jgi:hypothetical protein